MPPEPPTAPPVTKDPLAFERPRFRAAFKEHFEAMKIAPDLVELYSSYALSTVDRGDSLRRFIESLTPIKDKRYLDVGCAYGGFPVAFHAAGAREVVGFDYNADFLKYALLLREDYGHPIRFEQASILEEGLAERFGRFDIISCNDVIEHVSDPGRALSNLASLLNPGGLLCMEIPNRWSAAFVLKDGHFYKYALTSLPKYLADRRFARETNGGFHDVTYKSLDWYLNRLRRAGLTVTVEHGSLENVAATLAQTSATFDEVDWRSHSPEVDEQSARYARRIARAFHSMHGHWRADGAAADDTAVRLKLAFATDFWKVLVRAPAQ